MAPKRRRRLIAAFMAFDVLVVLAPYSTDWLASFGSSAEGGRLARMERTPRYRDGAFHNSSPGFVIPCINRRGFGVRIKARDRRNTHRISRKRNAELRVEDVSSYARDYGSRGLAADPHR